jgi:predicted metal-dependent hydrolase
MNVQAQPLDGKGRTQPPTSAQDPRYRAFFDCFNAGRYYEAHVVLEELWLEVRGQPDADFYKGLIQVAGAFVHLQKQRPDPAARLLRLARGYLSQYPARHHALDTEGVVRQIGDWLTAITQNHLRLAEVSDLRHPRLALG